MKLLIILSALSNNYTDLISFLARLDTNIVLVLATLASIVSYFLLKNFKRFILYYHARCMRKHNVVLLKSQMKSIKVEAVPEINFSFILTQDDIESEKVELRETFMFSTPEKTALFKQQVQTIRKYYSSIKDEIKEKQIPEHVLSISEIDYILQHVVTEENITTALNTLNKRRKLNDPSLAFIGNKLGLYDYSSDEKGLTWFCYKSDHLTWKIFKELYNIKSVPVDKDYSPNTLFNNLFERLEKHKNKTRYRSVLMHTLCYIFSSLGIDGIITGKNHKNQKVCLASLRSGRVDKSKTSRIHVSVDESFSDTDQSGNNDNYSVDHWVKRGIEEEIGILADHQKDFKITYTDFAIITGYGEIGLSCIIEAGEVDSLVLYPGQDKALESDGLFWIRRPNIFNAFRYITNPAKGVQKYVSSNKNNPMARFPWVEFAWPIYYRTFLRLFPVPTKMNYSFAVSSLLLITYLAKCPGKFDEIFTQFNTAFAQIKEIDYLNRIWASIITVKIGISLKTVLKIIISMIVVALSILKFFCRQYWKFTPWIPQWGGNVKVLQSTGKKRKEGICNINSGLYFMLDTPKNCTVKFKHFSQWIKPVWKRSDTKSKSYFRPKSANKYTIKLNELFIEEDPVCAVRIANVNEEAPISFYRASRANKDEGNFKIFSAFYHRELEISSLYFYVIRTKSEHNQKENFKKISFDFGIDKDYDLEFDSKSTSLEINENSLKCYFGLHNAHIEQHQFNKSLPKNFTAEYQLYDLFKYKGRFYWSSLHKSKLSLDNLSLFTNLYESCIDHYDPKDAYDWQVSDKENWYVDTVTNSKTVASYSTIVGSKETVYIDIIKMEAPTQKELEKKVNKLIERSLERHGGKMAEIEILAMQYLLIRNDIIVADFTRHPLHKCKSMFDLFDKLRSLSPI